MVDDDAGIRQLYRNVLTGCGYLIEFAEDGEAAWRMVTAEGDRHDLLITDYSMPNLSGVESFSRVCLLRTVRDVLQSDTGRAGRQPLAGE